MSLSPDLSVPSLGLSPLRHGRALLRLLLVVPHILQGAVRARLFAAHWSEAQRRQAVQGWARHLLWLCGVRLTVRGDAAGAQPGQGLMLVSNHISWLDIPTLHAVRFCRFVSKSEVAEWPIVGRLATTAGTLYLQRGSRRAAFRMLATVIQSLQAGDVVALFPEGTTSDGLDLLPFHPNLLQAAIDTQVPVQPVALQFLDASGRPTRVPCYIGDDTLLASLWRTLGTPGLTVQVTLGTPQHAQGRDRQQWAEALRTTVAGLRR